MVEEKIPDDAAEPSIMDSGTPKVDDSFVKKRLDHDGFFRSSFTDKKLVESFAKENLPEAVTRYLDFSTLEKQEDTFVDPKLSRCLSDVLYWIKFQEKPAYLYFLFEHKSWEPNFPHIQLLKNMTHIWETHLLKHKGIKKLPPIIPLLIYHGKSAWETDKSFVAMFDIPDSMKKYIPDFDMELFDLSHMPEEGIKGSVEVRIILTAFRYIFSADAISQLKKVFVLFNDLQDQAEKERYLTMLINYIGTVIVGTKPDQILNSIQEVWKEGGHMSKTLFETLEEKGEKRGIEKGEKRGIGIGEERTKLNTIANCIKIGMDTPTIAAIVELAIEKVEAIRDSIQRGTFRLQS